MDGRSALPGAEIYHDAWPDCPDYFVKHRMHAVPALAILGQSRYETAIDIDAMQTSHEFQIRRVRLVGHGCALLLYQPPLVCSIGAIAFDQPERALKHLTPTMH